MIGNYKFEISPKSFFQINKFQTEKLYNVAKEYLGVNENGVLLDLYSGIGTTSIYFSENFKKVIGVEVVKDSITDSKRNLKLNGITNVEFVYGKSEDKIKKLINQYQVDVISVDPPRKGLDRKVIETIIQSNIKKVVYISCNSSTLSRDVKVFLENGFKISKLKAVDMFSKTPHVESVAVLKKK